jgi:phospho-N-acetylmuramoyl-pentapeptide-transferase
VMLGCGLVGFIDDFLKIVLHRPLGLKARTKLLGQLLVGLLLAAGLYLLQRGTVISVPLSGLRFDLGNWYYPFIIFVLLAETNAVNLTDGLDGLAGGLMAIIGVAYVVIGWMTGEQEAAIFAAALAGGCLGFLRFNRHPARIFMGDTGSLALGGALTALAALTGTEILLILLGGVFVAEALSVVIQVVSFKTTGRRGFRMSPLHHHFELGGWPEGKVVNVFWLAGCCLAILSLLAMKGLG